VCTSKAEEGRKKLTDTSLPSSFDTVTLHEVRE